MIDRITLAEAQTSLQREFDRERCGCPACDNGVQLGHFACEQASEYMLEVERSGIAVRAYDDGVWYWFVADPRR